MTSIEKARYVIESNNFMTIASADESGKPWVSPVGFVYDQHYNFYWVSSKEALHSKNIAQRPEVGISIFGQMPSGSYDGVYIDAEAAVLNDDNEILFVIELFKKQRPQPARFETNSISDVTGDATWRMYKATPKQITNRSDTILNGQAITVREAIQF